MEKKETEARKELPPSEILAEYMATSPCLNFKNDHGYTVPPAAAALLAAVALFSLSPP